MESQTILTIHTHVITRNYRISLNHRDHQHWNLNISDVRESDRGSYMCQINTVPMKKQVGYLEVVGKVIFKYSYNRNFKQMFLDSEKLNSSFKINFEVLTGKKNNRSEKKLQSFKYVIYIRSHQTL